MIDAKDSDSDNDGIVDGVEVFTYATSPVSTDTDGDGLSDYAELFTYHTDPLLVDTDGDTLSDKEEVTLGADGYVTNPLSRDTDGDTLTDDFEVTTDPYLQARSPNLAALANRQVDDIQVTVSVPVSARSAGITALPNHYLTDPTRADTDSDGADDAQEIVIGSHPLDPDTDDDGLADGQEISLGTSPTNPDTDGDGVPDGLDPDPLSVDTDRDGLRDGAELVVGWNGDWVEAEDGKAMPGAVTTDPVFGNAAAQRGKDDEVVKWGSVELPAGVYRVMVRARAAENPGDVMRVEVSAGEVTLFEREYPLLSGIYRWHSTDRLTLVNPAILTVKVDDPQAGGASVLVDQLMMAAADGEFTFLRTLALDDDTDDDGLTDGEETAERTTWFEAEDFRDSNLFLAADLGASNSFALKSVLLNDKMVVATPDYDFPAGEYQLFPPSGGIPRPGTSRTCSSRSRPQAAGSTCTSRRSPTSTSGSRWTTCSRSARMVRSP